MTKKVLIIQRRLTEYRVPLFMALKEKLSKGKISLSILRSKPTAEELIRADEGFLPWGMNVRCQTYNFGNMRLFWQALPNKLVSMYDLIIIPHENSLLSNYRLLLARRHENVRLAFWGHGANFQNSRNGGLKKWLREWSMKQANWWFAYTSASVKRLIESGYPEAKITCLNNAIDTRSLIEWASFVSVEEKRRLLASLSLGGQAVGIYLGSLHKDKRLDFLFAAADELRKRKPIFELLIIGDGPLRSIVENFVRTRHWAKWIGAKHDREKVLYASLGKIMLNPGMVGLGILDSFALGIPMVTTDCGIHSPEIAYLEHGRNGFITPNEQDEYVQCVADLFEDPLLLERLKLNCREDAKKYTLENMVNNFCNGILSALNS